MNIEYSRQAVKVIERNDKPTKRRMREAIELIPQGDIAPLQGVDGGYRLRVGNWRILFSYKGNNAVYIRKIAPRGEAYKE